MKSNLTRRRSKGGVEIAMRWFGGYDEKSQNEGTARHLDRILMTVTKDNVTGALIAGALLLVQGFWMSFLAWVLILRHLFPNFFL